MLRNPSSTRGVAPVQCIHWSACAALCCPILRRRVMGVMIVPSSMHSDHFFPEIALSCSYAKPLINTTQENHTQWSPWETSPSRTACSPDVQGTVSCSRRMNLSPYTGRDSWFLPTERSLPSPPAARRRLGNLQAARKSPASLAVKLLRHPLWTWIPPAASHPPTRTNNHHEPRITKTPQAKDHKDLP